MYKYLHTHTYTNILRSARGGGGQMAQCSMQYMLLPHIHSHIYIYTYIHTYTHTHMHTYTHTYMHTYSHTHAYTEAHEAEEDTWLRAIDAIAIHTSICIYIYMYTYLHTPICMHVQKRARRRKTHGSKLSMPS